MDQPQPTHARPNTPRSCYVNIRIIGSRVTRDSIVVREYFEQTLAARNCYHSTCLGHGHLNGGQTQLGALLAAGGDFKLGDVLDAMGQSALMDAAAAAQEIGDFVEDVLGTVFGTSPGNPMSGCPLCRRGIPH